MGLRHRDRGAWAPALTLATVGAAISTYHILIDVGAISDPGSCDPSNPCTLRWKGFDHGWSTIQVGALCCFVFIIGLGLHALARRETAAPGPTIERPDEPIDRSTPEA
ncbi:MAG: hypothetical protein R2698_07280 [Microthrixaceae bacterium]